MFKCFEDLNIEFKRSYCSNICDAIRHIRRDTISSVLAATLRSNLTLNRLLSCLSAFPLGDLRKLPLIVCDLSFQIN